MMAKVKDEPGRGKQRTPWRKSPPRFFYASDSPRFPPTEKQGVVRRVCCGRRVSSSFVLSLDTPTYGLNERSFMARSDPHRRLRFFHAQIRQERGKAVSENIDGWQH